MSNAFPEVFPKQTRIQKCASEEGDRHTDGAPGTVVQVVGPSRGEKGELLLGYVVKFDDGPGFHVVAHHRVKRLEERNGR